MPYRNKAGAMRPSTIMLTLILLGLLGIGASLADAGLGVARAAPGLELRTGMVRDLGLTDLCLFTEARYTRHLSQADLHTPFQDHPMSFDHFPSGSIVPPPRFGG